MKIYFFSLIQGLRPGLETLQHPQHRSQTSPTLAMEQEHISLVKKAAGEPLQHTEPVQRVQAKQKVLNKCLPNS